MEKSDKYKSLFSTTSLKENLKKRSISGGIYIMAAESLNFVLRIGSIAVLARILIPEHFGLISMVTAITFIAERFKDLGLSLATVQQEKITHDQLSNLFWINVGVAVLLMIIISSSSYLIAWFYKDSRLIWITVAISTGLFWGGLTVQHQAILRRKMQFKKIAFINIGSTLLSILIAIFLAIKGYEYWAIVWREVARNFFMAIGTWMLCPWKPGLPARNSNIGKMLRFGRNITGFNLLSYLVANLDQILIGKFFGPSPLGLYRQAYQLIITPMSQFIFPFHYVAEPTLSILQNDPARYKQYFEKILTAVGFFSIPLALFLFFHSKDIILIVLGEKWIGSAEIFQILALSVVLNPVLSTTGFVMITCGKTERYFLVGLLNTILLIIALGIGLHWGVKGIAAARVVKIYIFLLPLIIISFKDTPVSVESFFTLIAPIIFSGLTMLLVLFVFYKTVTLENSYARILTSLPLAAVAYLVTWILIPGGKTKIKMLFSDFYFAFRTR